MPPLLAKIAFSFSPSSPHACRLKDEMPFISQMWFPPSYFLLTRRSISLTVGASPQPKSLTTEKQLSMARINLLREYGLSDQQIAKLITRLGGFLFQNFDSLRLALERTEELGFIRGSNMFFHAFVFAGTLKKETLEKKVSVFIEVCGWSEEEVYTAIRKSPSIFGISAETLMSKMHFLVNRAGMEPKIIASQPILLTYSLESRLMPRYNVLSALQAKGLVKKLSLRTLCTLSEKNFIQRYIVPYEKDVPELRAVYAVVSENKLIPGPDLGSFDAQTCDPKLVSFW